MNEQGDPIYIGVNIAAGVAFLGAVRGAEAITEDGADRIKPNDQLGDAQRYEDFRARLGQEFRRLQPAAVGIARTRKYNNWTMKNATGRFGLEAAAMIAAVQEGFECHLVTQEEAVKTVKVPLPRLSVALPARLGIEPTPQWEERSVAFLVAAHLANWES